MNVGTTSRRQIIDKAAQSERRVRDRAISRDGRSRLKIVDGIEFVISNRANRQTRFRNSVERLNRKKPIIGSAAFLDRPTFRRFLELPGRRAGGRRKSLRVFNAATTNGKAADGCGCRRTLERSTERERDRVALVAEINWRRLGDRRNSWARPGLLHAITDSFDLSLLSSLSLSRPLSLFLPVRSLAPVSVSVHRRRSSEARSSAPLSLGVRFCALFLSLSPFRLPLLTLKPEPRRSFLSSAFNWEMRSLPHGERASRILMPARSVRIAR